MSAVRLILNILWLVLAGIWLAIGYVLAGIIMCLLIITIPFGLQAFKLAGFVVWPFGRMVVPRPDADSTSRIVGNVLWLLLVGWWLALEHVVTAVALALTIIGIPFAIANLKLAFIAVWPFGREIVPVDDGHPAYANAISYDRR